MRNLRGTTLLVLVALVLSACSGTPEAGSPSVTTAEATTQVAPSAAATPSRAPTPAPERTTQATPTAPAEKTFTTPDGSLSFNYPQTWSVEAMAGQENSYAVMDGSGGTRATLSDKVAGLGYVSVTSGFDVGFKMPVPGIKGAAGQGVSVVVHGVYGQAVGAQAAAYALATDGSPEPIGRSGVEVPAGGYYVLFTGMVPLDTPTIPPSQAELMASATAFANSSTFAETAKVMASLTINPAKVTAVGCLGVKYKYRELNGISCDDAKAALDRVEKTGTGSGARNMETADFYCFYAGYGEKQNGQADVICRHQVTPDAISFEAWFK